MRENPTSTTPKIALAPAMAPGECRLVSAKKNAVSAPSVWPCSQAASLLSRATSALRPVTFHAMARKISPATRNPLQPATASARGERLGGCGLRSSGGGRASDGARRRRLLRLALLRFALRLLRVALGLALGP